jgi:predicted DNA-binding protein (UPF0251 family)
MPRPVQCRRVCLKPGCTYFKPAGIPTSTLKEIVVAVDELEALRLADVEGLYHEKAAEQMGVSRRTFGRIIDSARKKVAQALTQGMALRIEGGVIEMTEQRTFKCRDCEQEWQLPFGTGRPGECPHCESKNFHRAEQERGQGGRRRRGGRSTEAVDPSLREEPVAATETVATKCGGRRKRQRRRGSA